MRANEPVVMLMDRLRACLMGLRNDPLLADPQCHALHARVRALKPKTLTCLPVEEARFVVIDTETTGFKVYGGDEIVSIALLEMHGLEPTGREFTTLVNPSTRHPAGFYRNSQHLRHGRRLRPGDRGRAARRGAVHRRKRPGRASRAV